MKILLIGPQGSGKSTQADLLAKKLNLPKITVGDIFRQIANGDTAEGRKIKDILASGHLVDDQTTARLVKERINKGDIKRGFIMDGYPRTVEQKNLFDPSFDEVVYLNVPKIEAVKRLLRRGRTDDTAELIGKRLDLYYQQTQPLLEHYRYKGNLTEISGIGNVEKIQQRIRKSLEK